MKRALLCLILLIALPCIAQIPVGDETGINHRVHKQGNLYQLQADSSLSSRALMTLKKRDTQTQNIFDILDSDASLMCEVDSAGDWDFHGHALNNADISGVETDPISIHQEGAGTWNNAGMDVDFRMASDTESNLFYVDGTGIGAIGIGTNTPNNRLQVLGLINFDDPIFSTSIGSQAGAVNSGIRNSFFGYMSGLSNTTGTDNTGLGHQALLANTIGLFNTGVGSHALISNTIGISNVAVGESAMAGNLTGEYNTAVGVDSLRTNTAGNNNVALGTEAAMANTIGNDNVGLGWYAMFRNTEGSSNTAVGTTALYNNTLGNNNLALGMYSLYLNTTGSGNIALGLYSGGTISGGVLPNETSTNSIYIGESTKSLANGDDNEIIIGYNATGNGSNTTTLGNSSISDTYLKGTVHTPKVRVGGASENAYLTLPAGGTAAGSAPIKFTSQASPLSAVEQGAMELVGNSLQFTQLAKRRGVAMTQNTRVSDTTVENTITESGALQQADHGANYIEVGKVEEMVLRGVISQRSNPSATLTFNIKYAGVTIQSISTPVNTVISSSPFELRTTVTFRTTGSPGSAHIHSMLNVSGITVNDFGTVGTATIDTTTAQATTITAVWGEANGSDILVVNQGWVLCVEPDR